MKKKQPDGDDLVVDERETLAAQASMTVKLAASVASAYLQNNQVPAAELPNVISTIHASLHGIVTGRADERERIRTTPAVPIKKSVFDDHLICLEDGKKLTMLKRYLRSQFNMSVEEYRKKWGLPPDYPMVAPAYARLRSAFAKKIGLGRVPTGRKPKK